MKIGELSQQTGCSIQTIRFYERKGLLTTTRAQNNYRSYDKSAMQHLIFVKQCRLLGLSIEETKQLLQTRANPDSSCASINVTIVQHVAQVSERIEELQALKNTLNAIASACSDNRKIKDCGVLHQLQTAVDPQGGKLAYPERQN